MRIKLSELRQIIREEITKAYDEKDPKGDKGDLSSTHKDEPEGEGSEEDNPETDYSKDKGVKHR